MALLKYLLVVLCSLVLLACGGGKHTASAGAAPAAPAAREPQAMEYVRLSTTMGDIYLELNRTKAPLSVENFLGYVDRGEYDNTIFHRVIENFVVQGGGFSPQFRELPSGPALKNEWGNGLTNVRGSIGMARDTDPDTATREFFINVQDNPKLDTAREVSGNAGYAVFGHVYAGMGIVDQIRALKTTSHQDWKHPNEPDKDMQNVPLDPPVLTRAVRVSAPDAKRALDAEKRRR